MADSSGTLKGDAVEQAMADTQKHVNIAAYDALRVAHEQLYASRCDDMELEEWDILVGKILGGVRRAIRSALAEKVAEYD